MKVRNEFLENFSEILGEEVSDFTSDLKSYTKWDSVNMLRIMKHFELIQESKFSVVAFLKAETVEDVFNIVCIKTAA